MQRAASMHAVMTSKPLLPGAVLLLAVAACLLVPTLDNQRKFPYTGVWVGQIPPKDGAYIKAALGFKQDGTCSYHITGIAGYTDYGCSYRMQGRTALVVVGYRTREQEVIHKHQVSSRDGGVTLNLVPQEVSTKQNGHWNSNLFNGEIIPLDKQ